MNERREIPEVRVKLPIGSRVRLRSTATLRPGARADLAESWEVSLEGLEVIIAGRRIEVQPHTLTLADQAYLRHLAAEQMSEVTNGPAEPAEPAAACRR